MKMRGIPYLGIVLLLLGMHVEIRTAQTVQTTTGMVAGLTQRGVVQFLGIPFAKAPVGDLRWKNTQAVEPWTKTLQATSFGNECAQVPYNLIASFVSDSNQGNGRTYGSENCLFLNILADSRSFASNDSSSSIFVIHGGSFVTGSGGQFPIVSTIQSGPMATRDAIFVTTNYRLGVFGFLLTNEMLASGQSNFGLRDMGMALQWTHVNIKAFGGDPNSQLLYGHSSGGYSVLLHYCNSPSWPYFSTILATSPGPWMLNDKVSALSIAATLYKQSKCSDLDCLMNKTTYQMIYDEIASGTTIQYIPSIDGFSLRQPLPMLMYHDLCDSSASVVVGIAESEGIDIVPMYLPFWGYSTSQVVTETVFNGVIDTMGVPNKTAIVQWYTTGTWLYKLQQLMANSGITCGSHLVSVSVSDTVQLYFLQLVEKQTSGNSSHQSLAAYFWNNPGQIQQRSFTQSQITCTTYYQQYIKSFRDTGLMQNAELEKNGVPPFSPYFPFTDQVLSGNGSLAPVALYSKFPYRNILLLSSSPKTTREPFSQFIDGPCFYWNEWAIEGLNFFKPPQFDKMTTQRMIVNL